MSLYRLGKADASVVSTVIQPGNKMTLCRIPKAPDAHCSLGSSCTGA